MLTKIHKKTPVGRPIVSGSSGPTERITSFVGSLLQPIAIKQESYIKDTTVIKGILPFVTTYNPTTPNLKKILMKHWHIIQRQPRLAHYL